MGWVILIKLRFRLKMTRSSDLIISLGIRTVGGERKGGGRRKGRRREKGEKEEEQG